MSDLTVRMILVGGVALTTVLVGWIGSWMRRRSHEGGAIEDPALFEDIPERILFFTTTCCPSCDAARVRLIDSEVAFREIGYGDAAELHTAAGVTGVPLILVRAQNGGVVGRIAGKPSKWALQRLFRRVGIK